MYNIDRNIMDLTPFDENHRVHFFFETCFQSILFFISSLKRRLKLYPLLEGTARIALCTSAGVGLIGSWRLPGQPLLVAFAAWHLLRFQVI